MAHPADPASRVRGIAIPRRRFTRWAALYFVAFVCLPLLGFCLAVDAALYVIFTNWFDRCYGLFCLFGR